MVRPRCSAVVGRRRDGRSRSSAAPRPCSMHGVARSRSASGSSAASRVPRVQPGDEERGDELRQPEDEGDVDVADDLVAHEVARVGGADDVSRYQARKPRSSGRRSDGSSSAAPEVGALPQSVVSGRRRCAAPPADARRPAAGFRSAHEPPSSVAGSAALLADHGEDRPPPARSEARDTPRSRNSGLEEFRAPLTAEVALRCAHNVGSSPARPSYWGGPMPESHILRLSRIPLLSAALAAALGASLPVSAATGRRRRTPDPHCGWARQPPADRVGR